MCSGGAPPSRGGERRAGSPFSGKWVEDKRVRECREEVVGGGGEEYEVARNRHGLDWDSPGNEGGVADEEAERLLRRWWEGVPFR